MIDRDVASIEQAFKEQAYLLRPVEGDSMMPLLDQKTDLIKLVPVSGKLKLYDLPLYRRPDGTLVLHRIIRVRKKHYVTCGDNRYQYERVPCDWVIALAVGRYRCGEYLSFEDGNYLSKIYSLCKERDRGSNRFRFAVERVFPPVQDMKLQFPILLQHPVALPLCYVARWGRVLKRKLKKKRH